MGKGWVWQMGQAFDREGNVMGEARGHTKAEVFEALSRDHPDAAEIRVRTTLERERLADEDPVLATDPLREYRSHKIVRAAKITRCLGHTSGKITFRFGSGRRLITVSAAYVAKHKPKIGGYYVKYSDGYESWSPAEAFESGYVLITD